MDTPTTSDAYPYFFNSVPNNHRSKELSRQLSVKIRKFFDIYL